MPYRLEADEKPTAGMRRLALERAERAAERLREAAELEDPSECIHAARKDLKKLRAAVRLIRRELGGDLYRAENERYREAGRLLAPSRDAEVKVETLVGLRERSPGRLESTDAADWLEELRRERDRAVRTARIGDADSIEAALEAVEEGRSRIDAWPLETDSWKLVAPGLRDSLDQADELADVLGEHHDLTVLRDDLFSRELPLLERPVLVAAIAERQEQLARTAFGLGERLYAKQPRRFRRKMRRGWKQWRKR